MTTSQPAAVPEGRLTVHDTGAGPAVLFLHAFPLDASQWDHQVAALSGDFRCLRPDMWGCGSTPPHREPAAATLDEYAAAVVAELDSRDVADFALVGSSIGGYAAYAMWRLAPQRIRCMVLASARSAADGEAARDERRNMAERALREGVEFIVEPMVQRLLSESSRHEVHIADPVRGRIRRCTPEGIAACQSAMATRADSSALLGEISIPALVIAGDHDGVVGLPEMEAVASALPRGEFAALPGVGHLANLEAPHEFSALLSKALT